MVNYVMILSIKIFLNYQICPRVFEKCSSYKVLHCVLLEPINYDHTSLKRKVLQNEYFGVKR